MPRYRVLLVDDQRDIRRVLSMGLSTLEMKVEVVDVPSAEEAMLVAAHSAFDLMISDVRLPGISGLDLVRRVQKLHPAMKIMLITGITDPAIRQDVESAGADAFFYKPIEIEDFLNAVRRALGSAVEPTPQTESPSQPEGGEQALALVDRLENLRRKSVMGMAAVLNTAGEVVAQAGFLTGVYEQQGLASGLAGLYAASLSVSQTLRLPEPENLFYLTGKDQYFYIVSINNMHLLVLTAEQPFQDQLLDFNQWLPDSVRELDQILTGRLPPQDRADPDVVLEALVGEAEPPPGEEEETIFRSLEEELAEVEVSKEDQAAADALFAQAEKQVNRVELDDFWDNLVEESHSQHISEDGISFEEALDLGLAPGEDEEA